MLKPEQAERQLKKLHDDQWTKALLPAVGRLPRSLGDSVRTMLDESEPDDYEGWLRDVFGPMGEDERRAVFEVFFGPIAPVVERGWQLHDRLPYQAKELYVWSYFPRAFRAPGKDDVLLLGRAHWVHHLLHITGPYRQSVPWLAAWASHFSSDESRIIGLLLAGAIDAGDAQADEVFAILRASAAGEHEVGGMGRHVTRAMLCSSRPECWEFIEKMLLAAQRQEGLRQEILESVHEAHPEAFRRMLRLIVDERLVRFSATVRALDLWLGYRWEAASTGVVNATIEHLLDYLDEPTKRRSALGGDDAEQVFLALWATAFLDGPSAIAPAAALLKHRKPGHRYVATQMLELLRLPASEPHILTALADEDLRVTTRALDRWTMSADLPNATPDPQWFEPLERLLSRYPKKRTVLEPIVWPWTGVAVDQDLVAKAMIRNLGTRPASCLIPHLGGMDTWTRAHAVDLITAQEEWDQLTRTTVVALVGDGSTHVRQSAVEALAQRAITAGEAQEIEALLTRTAGDVRRGVLRLLQTPSDAAALASADRLLASSKAPQRLAGLELLRGLTESGRATAECRARVKEGYAGTRGATAAVEQQHLEVILRADSAATPTLVDALGLAPAADRTWARAPVAKGVTWDSPVTKRVFASLEQRIRDCAERIITAPRLDGTLFTGPFGQWTLGKPYHRAAPDDRSRLPLADVWDEWWRTRGDDLRDPDGMEQARALAVAKHWDEAIYRSDRRSPAFVAATKRILGDIDKPPAPTRQNVLNIIHWIARLEPPTPAMITFVLDAAESALATIPAEWLVYTEADRQRREKYFSSYGTAPPNSLEWRWHSAFTLWLDVAEDLHDAAPDVWTPEHYAQNWRLWRWIDEPLRPAALGGASLPKNATPLPRHGPPLWVVTEARAVDAATDADVMDLLVGERSDHGNRHVFVDLRKLSGRKSRERDQFPALARLVDRCRDRIIEVELTRGDLPTAASLPAMALRAVWGVDHLVAVLRALGKRSLRRGYSWDKESLETVFSHLIRSTLPREQDTPKTFATKVRAAGISETRLIELALYAPQWAPFVEHTLGWPGLVDAVWWVHGHTKSSDWTVDREIRELWKGELAARTPLTTDDLLDGAVDVAWFHRVHETLGAERWEQLYDAAKYASSGAGHTRARLFADAMTDAVAKKELVTRIGAKRHQDAVRALGLLPLAGGRKREADVLERYQLIHEFIRGSRQFGSQRQASEKRAAHIGLDNLARSAGYADPIRLQWAMEARAIADLAEGPITVKAGDVTVALAVNPWGDVELTVEKEGKTLADVPAKLKQQPKIKALRERKVEVKRQASRIRASLEQIMVRGDTLTGAELRELMGHPLLAPMLRGLVLVGDGVIGYPVKHGQALEDHAGKAAALGKTDELRLAHPLDLLPAASWHRWQKDCFARERVQPFKQVFRELYRPTADEKRESAETQRYAGHQVQPRQALALLGQRGWINYPEEGVRKTFHDAGLVAWLEFQEAFFTPAEVEGLTLEAVRFTRRDGKPVSLTAVPPRLFSEAMRDLDLVVSVAHRGGVDPEATASTVEMRAALVEQTCALLQLKNVTIKDRYARIEGRLGRYSVHLGSAMVHKLPGDVIIIIAVHGQHRGRLFLPFADDDPRTAEVMSKVLLLARDHEIKDPGILEQIRAS